MHIRQKLYRTLYSNESGLLGKKVYDFGMIVLILASIVPLAFKSNYAVFELMDKACAVIFLIDYILRWICFRAPEECSAWQYIKYPFTSMALIDLLSILPSFAPINGGLKILRVIRMTRAMRVLRTFKFIRYSKNADIILQTMKNQRQPLGFVLTLATSYVLITALIIFNVEPDTFHTFFDAVYWSVVSLTTMGYGDIYPVSVSGRVITIISSIFGIAIVALPSGIITAGYMEELEKRKEK